MERFSIQFTRAGKQLQVFVFPKLPDKDCEGWRYTGCLGNFDSAMTAELILQSLRLKFVEALRAKVRASYDRGYRDGRGHHQQLQDFFADFDTNEKTGIGY